MTCLDVDDHYARETPTDIKSVIMTTIVAVAVWELWSRHLVPVLFLQELSIAELWLAALDQKGRLFGEFLYFLTIFMVIPILYFYLVKPLMETVSPFCHWISHGLFYGVAFFVLISSFASFSISYSGEDFSKFFLPYPAFFGSLLTGLSITGFLRLRALGREII